VLSEEHQNGARDGDGDTGDKTAAAAFFVQKDTAQYQGSRASR
jgi:hypothetical protein